MSLLDSLGLDKVEADPNHLPDGKYPAEVFKSELVLKKSSDVINHVITFRVTDGARKGVTKSEWFPLGKDPQYNEDRSEVIGFGEVTMSEAQKPWYKKRFLDLGVTEANIGTTKPSDLVGIPVSLGIKNKDGFTNISFATKRDETTAPAVVGAPAVGEL